MTKIKDEQTPSEDPSPSPETVLVAVASEEIVYDSKGNKVTFGDLFKSTKTIVVFIRHFFCGSCQAYVSQLAQIPLNVLIEGNVKLIIVGCGDWELIDNYKKNTGFQGDIFADPGRELYRTFGLIQSLKLKPSGEQKKSYVPGFAATIFKSIWNGPLSNPTHVGKQGNISQLGGDFILGPGNVCVFAHRMKHTEDHMELEDLLKEAGVSFSL